MSRHKGGFKPAKPLRGFPKELPPSPPQDPPTRLCFEHLCEQGSRYCLSLCDTQQLWDLSDALRRFTQVSFRQAAHNGGLRWKTYDDDVLDGGATRPPQVDASWKVGAFRVSGPFRVFGARQEAVLHVLWFDRQHEIVPTDF